MGSVFYISTLRYFALASLFLKKRMCRSEALVAADVEFRSDVKVTQGTPGSP